MDIKLLLGYAACLTAGIGGGYSYINSFEASKTLLAVCCTIYFILTGIMSLFVIFVEGNQIFAGSKSEATEARIIRVTTDCKKYDENVTITFYLKQDQKAQYQKFEKTKSVGKWFDVKGRLAFNEVKKDLDDLLQKKKKIN